MRTWAIYSFLALAVLLGPACARTKAQAKDDPLAGHFLASGGGGAIYHVQALTNRFTQLHPNVTFQTEDIGSDASVKLTESGAIDVGFTSRDLTTDEKTQLDSLPIGAVGTAVMVSSDNPVSNLTADQVRQIFTGQISDWSQVGGAPGEIRVMVREKTASTRKSFEDYFFNGTKPAYAASATELHDIDSMAETARSFKTAVGMVTLENVTLKEAGTKLVGIDGVPATLATLRDGTYPVQRNAYLVYSPDPSKVKPVIRAFLDFAQSPDGRKALDAVNAPAPAKGQ